MKPLTVPYADKYMAAGQRNKVDPYLLAAQGKAESMSWNKDIVECRRDSPRGAKGIAQFMPSTAEAMDPKVDPCNVDSAIDGQARLMHALIDKFHSEELALAAYNSGTARIEKLGRVPRIKETKNYCAFILAEREKLKS